MSRKHIIILAITSITLGGFIAGCGSDSEPSSEKQNTTVDEPESNTSERAAKDESEGKGKFTDVKLNSPLDKTMVASGNKIYEVKCGSCHKLTGEKLVGPGWKGVTDRRKPEWIMNFVTNTDEMIDKDPAAQAMLEECMVRMPNQNLSDEEARHVLEFMLNNDGKK